MGEVGRPGIYPIVGSGKLFDILAEAGGATPMPDRLLRLPIGTVLARKPSS